MNIITYQATDEYRVYGDGRAVFEDDFDEEDNSLPYYDDYGTYLVTSDTDIMSLPIELQAYLTEPPPTMEEILASVSNSYHFSNHARNQKRITASADDA